jgi:ureidoglycolate hydrolase
MRAIRLELADVTHESWSPFGALPSDEGTRHDTADLEFLWNDGAVNFITHTTDEISFSSGSALCELLNRHDTHTQTLMPYDADGFVVVAPAGVDFSEGTDLDSVRAFRVPRLLPIHLARGTWHWGPYPIGTDSVRVLNVQGRGYPDDNRIVFLAHDHHVTFEIPLS